MYRVQTGVDRRQPQLDLLGGGVGPQLDGHQVVGLPPVLAFAVQDVLHRRNVAGRGPHLQLVGGGVAGSGGHKLVDLHPEVPDQEDMSEDGLKVGVVHGAVGDGAGLAHGLGHRSGAVDELGTELGVLLEQVVEVVLLKDPHSGGTLLSGLPVGPDQGLHMDRVQGGVLARGVRRLIGHPGF